MTRECNWWSPRKGCRGRDCRRHKGSFWSNRNVSHLHFGDGGYMAHWTVIKLYTHTHTRLLCLESTLWVFNNHMTRQEPQYTLDTPSSVTPTLSHSCLHEEGRGCGPVGISTLGHASSSPGDSEQSLPFALARLSMKTHKCLPMPKDKAVYFLWIGAGFLEK